MIDQITLGYTRLLMHRLTALEDLATSLSESQEALFTRDVDKTAAFTKRQILLCEEIMFLNRDIQSAMEKFGNDAKPLLEEVATLLRRTASAEKTLLRRNRVHAKLLSKMRHSLNALAPYQPSSFIQQYSPISFLAMRLAEE